MGIPDCPAAARARGHSLPIGERKASLRAGPYLPLTTWPGSQSRPPKSFAPAKNPGTLQLPNGALTSANRLTPQGYPAPTSSSHGKISSGQIYSHGSLYLLHGHGSQNLSCTCLCSLCPLPHSLTFPLPIFFSSNASSMGSVCTENLLGHH